MWDVSAIGCFETINRIVHGEENNSFENGRLKMVGGMFRVLDVPNAYCPKVRLDWNANTAHNLTRTEANYAR
jgi:hypothetical protein